MKRLLFILSMALMPMLLNAQSQPRQALRVGGGLNMSAAYDRDWNNTGNVSLGVAITMDYQYVLSKYFDFNLALTFFSNDYAPQATRNNYSTSLRFMLTPLPNSFRYIQIGAGLAYSYAKTIFEEKWIDPNLSFFYFARSKLHLFGVDIPLRFYAIDNKKYQLFFDYTINYRMLSYDSDTHFRNQRHLYNTATINFGVKF